MTTMTEEDFGSFWLGADGNVWRIARFADRPTVTWVRVDDPSIRRGGCVGSPLFYEFKRLVPEAPPCRLGAAEADGT